MNTPTAVFKYPENIVMYLPLSSILSIDGNIVTLYKDAPDYVLVRNGVKELAPAIKSINILESIITFI